MEEKSAKEKPFSPWSKLDWVLLGLIFIAFGFSIFAAPKIPDIVPIHWNIEGQPDDYGSKIINLFLSPAIALFILLLMSVLPAIDPLKKNYSHFSKEYSFLKSILTFFFLGLHAILMWGMLTSDYSMMDGKLFPLMFGFLFIALGWIMPKFKRNFFAGIRTPWTLADDTVWMKTHIFAGQLFITTGVLSILAAFFSSKIAFATVISLVILASIASMIYSYIIFKKINKN